MTNLRTLLLGVVLSASAHAHAESLRVATFNVAWLADAPLADMAMVRLCEAEAKAERVIDARPTPACRTGVFRIAEHYALLARYIAALDADIIAFQEVQGDEALRRILADGQYAANGEWTWVVNPDPKNAKQRVAIAVRKRVLKSLRATPIDELGAPLIREKRGGLLVTIDLKSGKQIQAVVVHMKARCHRSLDFDRRTTREDEEDAKACAQLRAQTPALARVIDGLQRRRGNIMILGDFNRAFDRDEEKCSGDASLCAAKTLWASLDNDQPAGVGLDLATRGHRHPEGCYAPRYGAESVDHVMLTGALFGKAVNGSVRSHPFHDFDKAGGLLKGAHRFLSDHCPVSVEIKLD